MNTKPFVCGLEEALWWRTLCLKYMPGSFTQFSIVAFLTRCSQKVLCYYQSWSSYHQTTPPFFSLFWKCSQSLVMLSGMSLYSVMLRLTRLFKLTLVYLQRIFHNYTTCTSSCTVVLWCIFCRFAGEQITLCTDRVCLWLHQFIFLSQAVWVSVGACARLLYK